MLWQRWCCALVGSRSFACAGSIAAASASTHAFVRCVRWNVLLVRLGILPLESSYQLSRAVVVVGGCTGSSYLKPAGVSLVKPG